MTARRQQTINVNGHKIKILSRAKTYMGNLSGYAVTITDNRGNRFELPHWNTVVREEAEEAAFVKFVKKFAERP